MHIPFIDLGRSIKPQSEDILKGWAEALAKTEFVGGKSVKDLELRLAETLDTKFFVTCANGTDALIISLQALGIGMGQKVAMPNVTFWAPYEAIRQVGAEAVLIDIDPDDLQMDIAEFKKAHHRFGFDACVIAHLYGWASHRLQELRDYCRDHDITLLEDGAQSFGVKLADGRSVYADAAISTISFYPAKVFGGCSDGGGIAVNDPILADKVRALCNHGRAGHYTYDYIGWNSRMSGLNAKFLAAQLPHQQEFITSRQKALEVYREELSPLIGEGGPFRLHLPPEGQTGNGYLTVLVSQNQPGDVFVKALTGRNIGAARTYPQTISQQPPARYALRLSELPHSERFCQQVINLPIFAGITSEECQVAAKALIDITKEL